MSTSSGRVRPIGYEPITIDRSTREIYIDFLRAISLIVVVIWHWVFTVLSISETRVDANNPIGTTPGLWIATWVLQVLPLFFFVGGSISSCGTKSGREAEAGRLSCTAA